MYYDYAINNMIYNALTFAEVKDLRFHLTLASTIKIYTLSRYISNEKNGIKQENYFVERCRRSCIRKGLHQRGYPV